MDLGPGPIIWARAHGPFVSLMFLASLVSVVFLASLVFLVSHVFFVPLVGFQVPSSRFPVQGSKFQVPSLLWGWPDSGSHLPGEGCTLKIFYKCLGAGEGAQADQADQADPLDQAKMMHSWQLRP